VTETPHDRSPRMLTQSLEGAPPWLLVAYAAAAAFATYFSMYAFRKPFLAVTYDTGGLLWLEPKTLLAVSQLFGYLASKYVGSVVVSGIRPGQRKWFLFSLIGAAELALVLFAVVPDALRPLAIMANGFPLGMVWGLVVLYLEGRRTSEILLAVLTSSYIFASAIVKDIGRWMISDMGVSTFWMPAATGAMFLPVFLIAVTALDQVPRPTDADRAERVARRPMTGEERKLFVSTFKVGLAFQFLVFFFITAFRDVRDIYSIEVFEALGYGGEPTLFTQTEWIPGVVAALALMSLSMLPAGKPTAILGNYAVMLTGVVLLASGTLAFDMGQITGLNWMVLTGVGGYLMYVANATVFWDRLIASTGFVGTAVFAAYLSDSFGYSGSFLLQVFRDAFLAGTSRLDFLRWFSYGVSALGAVIALFNGAYFVRQARARR
jgi:hypothetical protein